MLIICLLMQYFILFWQNDIQNSMEWSGIIYYPLRARLKGDMNICGDMLQLVLNVFDYSVGFFSPLVF